MLELRRILCVDDDPDILFLAKVSLEKVGGFKVLTASSGAEALDTLRHDNPDLILLDVMMPDMDGPSTLAAIQAAQPLRGTPVLFLTARVRPSELNNYLQLGACGVIAKPFDPMRLHTEVRAVWNMIQNAELSA